MCPRGVSRIHADIRDQPCGCDLPGQGRLEFFRLLNGGIEQKLCTQEYKKNEF